MFLSTVTGPTIVTPPPLSCFNPGRPTSLWWAQNVSHVRESLRDAFEETFRRKQTRYDGMTTKASENHSHNLRY